MSHAGDFNSFTEFVNYMMENEPEDRGIRESATCLDCGRECDVVYEDEGLGVTEAWGVKENNVQICASSKCCGAAID